MASEAGLEKEAKMDLFEDDNEFKEFEIRDDWAIESLQQWDDDDVNDDFSLQLKAELESNNE